MAWWKRNKIIHYTSKETDLETYLNDIHKVVSWSPNTLSNKELNRLIAITKLLYSQTKLSSDAINKINKSLFITGGLTHGQNTAEMD